jgi:hypothetical protein
MHALLKIITGELPWVETVEVEEGDELDVEALALHLSPEVELDQLLLRGMESEPRHHDVVVVRVPAATAARRGRSLATPLPFSSCCRNNAVDGALPVLEVSAHGIARAGSDGDRAGELGQRRARRARSAAPLRRRRIWGSERGEWEERIREGGACTIDEMKWCMIYTGVEVLLADRALFAATHSSRYPLDDGYGLNNFYLCSNCLYSLLELYVYMWLQ